MKSKSPGFYTPIDITPGESFYGHDFRELKARILATIKEHYGEPCETKDTDDFPDEIFPVGDPDAGRCPRCLVYEKFEAFWKVFYSDEDYL